MEELKDCPFCGGKPEITQDCANGFKIKCTNCLIGYRQKTLRNSLEWLKEAMITTWNTRV